MEELALVIKFIISGLLGALIGLEREKRIQERKKEDFAGLRTFTLTTTLGTLSAYISSISSIYLLVAIAFGITLMSLGAYLATTYFNKDVGITSEISFLIAFLLGIMVFFGYESVAVAFTITMVAVLTLRENLHAFVGKIREEDLMDTLKFAIVVFVILPFLPNETIDPFNVINPFQVWLMVVFVSGISFFGYILTRITDAEKGIELTGILGGLVSSTAVTSSMAAKSKRSKNNSPFIFATIIASSIMFIRVLFEVFVTNSLLLPELLPPIVTMCVVGVAASFFIWKRRTKVNAKVELEDPFKLRPALIFGGLFMLILVFTKVAGIYFGSVGLYITSLISGLVDMDAITLSMTTMAGKTISNKVAGTAIMLALFSNTAFKFGISYVLGDRDFGKKVGIIFGLMMISGFLTLLIF